MIVAAVPRALLILSLSAALVLLTPTAAAAIGPHPAHPAVTPAAHDLP